MFDNRKNNPWGGVGIQPSVHLRAVMQQVYIWMTMGLLTTAVTAILTVETGLSDTLIQNPLIYIGAFLLELGLVFWLSMGINRMSPGMAISVFFLYSAINGFTLSLLLLAYTGASITAAFVSTASMFGAMSIYGATTKTDLTRWGNLLFMALIGLVIAMVVNIFLASSAMSFVISLVGVLLFTALTAYDTQRISIMASNPALATNPDLVTRVAVIGALHLYLDFINLFIFMLRLIGNRR